MVNYKESDGTRHVLYLPNKFLRPFPTQHKGKNTIHYLLARRNLERKEIDYIGDVKDIRFLGVIYPSGRIVYVKVVKVKVIENQLKFVTYHN
ncbi:hypothetical protein [Enterococcus faecalis]|uniref:hypothetical protein n=1 Tax=Enterococcus faecalis TaxID=1351 RepID=UPI001A963462|nr:hypothetical protein [Enterococcus faecalis]MBO1138029.1 hypothetical protein [Enterococcus faecalis]